MTMSIRGSSGCDGALLAARTQLLQTESFRNLPRIAFASISKTFLSVRQRAQMKSAQSSHVASDAPPNIFFFCRHMLHSTTVDTLLAWCLVLSCLLLRVC